MTPSSRSTFDRKAAIALARNILANMPDSYTEEQLNDIGTRARHWVWVSVRDQPHLAGSARQEEALRLWEEGMPTVEIAERLGVSHSRVYKLRNRAEEHRRRATERRIPHPPQDK
jgi:DNA-binding NarL/FixJ family response regulator